jgi:LuxR family maltose regulon positive regulatory protein
VAEHFVAAIPQLARALLLSVAGRPDGAVEASSRALELAGRGAGRLELAYALAVRAHADGAAQDSQRWREDARRLTRSCPDPGRLPARLARLRGPAVTRPRPLPVPAEGTTALSERERELLPLLAGTLSQREIGAVLHLSLNTVKTHSRMLFRKLGVSSRAEAVTRARELGLLEVGRERRP